MNREIKFRGKRIDNGQWVYGDYTDNRFDEPSIWEDGYRIEIDHKTVGQYTGMNDSEGIEIFEGDICEVTRFDYNGQDIQEKCFVKFEDGAFIMFTQKEDGFYIAMCDIDDVTCDVKVIGNIHDNPELLGNI